MASSLLQFVLFVASLLIAVPVVWSQTQMLDPQCTGKLATVRFINNQESCGNQVANRFCLTQIYTRFTCH